MFILSLKQISNIFFPLGSRCYIRIAGKCFCKYYLQSNEKDLKMCVLHFSKLDDSKAPT